MFSTGPEPISASEQHPPRGSICSWKQVNSVGRFHWYSDTPMMWHGDKPCARWPNHRGCPVPLRGPRVEATMVRLVNYPPNSNNFGLSSVCVCVCVLRYPQTVVLFRGGFCSFPFCVYLAAHRSPNCFNQHSPPVETDISPTFVRAFSGCTVQHTWVSLVVCRSKNGCLRSRWARWIVNEQTLSFKFCWDLQFALPDEGWLVFDESWNDFRFLVLCVCVFFSGGGNCTHTQTGCAGKYTRGYRFCPRESWKKVFTCVWL